MSIMKARDRRISLRLTQQEYEKLCEFCAATDARSVSDCARAAVSRMTDLEREEGRSSDRPRSQTDGRSHGSGRAEARWADGCPALSESLRGLDLRLTAIARDVGRLAKLLAREATVISPQPGKIDAE